jgi:hypothetical protein
MLLIDLNQDKSKELWDTITHVFAIAGALVTGTWAYFNFVKSRRYYPRLELAVSGEIRRSQKGRYIVPRITLKNIGQSRVMLFQRGSGYRLWTTSEGNFDLASLPWSDGEVVQTMLEDHKWIEPGESVVDESKIFSLPEHCVAVKIQVRLVAQVRKFPHANSEWNCSTVVGPNVIALEG